MASNSVSDKRKNKPEGGRSRRSSDKSFEESKTDVKSTVDEDEIKSSGKRSGPNPQYTFFYGVKDTPFSQFRAADFEVDGVLYTCAEMYMMHQKAVLFGDHEIAEQILTAGKPAAMKALGRKVRNFDEEVWKQHRRQIVKKGNIAKFSQNAGLKAELMATRGTTLVEASPRDRIWGIGMGKDNPRAQDKEKWRGQNLLGYILTEVREELENEEQKQEKERLGGEKK